MPITVKCEQCGQELIVKEEMIGQLGKCPRCLCVQTLLALDIDAIPEVETPVAAPAPPVATVPPPEIPVAAPEIPLTSVPLFEMPVALAPQPEIPVARVPPPEIPVATVAPPEIPVATVWNPSDLNLSRVEERTAREQDVIDADMVEEDERDVIDAEVIGPDDRLTPAPAPEASRPKAQSSRGPWQEESELNERQRMPSRGDREAADERGVNKKRKKDLFKGSRHREDDEDDPKAKKRARIKRNRWNRTGIGVLLHMIGSWLYTGAWAIVVLVCVIGMIMAISASVRGVGLRPASLLATAGFLAILLYLARALYFISLILWVVGPSLSIMTPGKHGEMGLAITNLAVNGLTLLFLLLWFVPLGQLSFYMAGLSVYLLPMLELTRFTLFGIFQWAVCKTLHDDEAASTALKAGIIVPCYAISAALLYWFLIFGVGPKAGKFGAIMILLFIFALALCWVAMLFWYSMVILRTRDAIDRV